MYLYRNKKTNEVVLATRFHHYSAQSYKKIETIFNGYPFEIDTYSLLSGYVEEQILFTDNQGNQQALNNNDWLVLKHNKTFELMKHPDFKATYDWQDVPNITQDFINNLYNS